jgi:hypothetical protein
MATLHADKDMAAQLERTLIGAYCDAADLGEAIAVADRVAPGDYDQWHDEWSGAAAVAETAARDAAARGHGANATRGYLRSSEYRRQAYFFLRHDLASRFRDRFTAPDWQRVLDADPGMDADLEGFLASPRDKEFYGAWVAATGAGTFGAWLRTMTGYTLRDRAGAITCPTLLTDGEGDFASQSQALYDALTCEKEYRLFTAAEGAGGHCEGMGQRVWQQAVFSWLSEIAKP